ncbi:type II toxin-antitoxin system PemK/MazF family toxin [Pseudoglutamicibacter cumminsii]|uniref:Type II toxin-antitoxin system PemK/MazF family toxin n=1 Tax=Pseudoglutamicibacter cumminsii TaxID=156979 RepID=A0AAP4FHB4_9MICC|nr:type II toxin-antitoxin system PemK/MazF family toxin [Pseudoglutamicibacter cumminsii]MDK6275892.1 type II toxin-antitoxin system PemK/MazF family toxin [Pseudoglutamicibacter cumminsii]
MSSQGRFLSRLLRAARPLVERYLSSQRTSNRQRPGEDQRRGQAQRTGRRPSGSTSQRSPQQATQTSQYPGDYCGRLNAVYDPHPDGNPDPGEVVWAWVPYEEDHSKGKDRPVLLAGWDGPWLLGFMLTSKDHDDRHDHEEFVDIGSGAWDKERRPSEARVSRVIRIDPESVRRIGAILDKARFDLVISEYHRQL